MVRTAPGPPLAPAEQMGQECKNGFWQGRT